MLVFFFFVWKLASCINHLQSPRCSSPTFRVLFSFSFHRSSLFPRFCSVSLVRARWPSFVFLSYSSLALFFSLSLFLSGYFVSICTVYPDLHRCYSYFLPGKSFPWIAFNPHRFAKQRIAGERVWNDNSPILPTFVFHLSNHFPVILTGIIFFAATGIKLSESEWIWGNDEIYKKRRAELIDDKRWENSILYHVANMFGYIFFNCTRQYLCIASWDEFGWISQLFLS